MLKRSAISRTIRMIATVFVASALLLMSGTAAEEARAEEVSLSTARTVANNFLKHMVRVYGGWAGSTTPEVIATEIVEHDGEVVGYNFLVSPSGHVLIPADDELPPIKMYSEKSSLSVGTRVDENGFPVPEDEQSKSEQASEDERAWISSTLHQGKKAGQSAQEGDEEGREEGGEEESADSDDPELKSGVDYAAPGWELFTMDEEEFEAAAGVETADANSTDPLLTTTWAQGTPDSGDLYNRFTPIHSSGCHTLTGCTATALAQIIHFHSRPLRGRGNVTYTWYNGAANQTLSRDFSSAAYDWDNMPDALAGNSTETQKNAVSRLMADLGYALQTDFGCLASGAAMPQAVTVLKDHYRYKDSMMVVNRSDYGTSDQWIDLFKNEIESERPALLRIQESGGMGHSAVVDGYRAFPSKTLHINMGWGANYNGWYVPDDFTALGYTWNNTGYQAAVIGIAPPEAGVLNPVSPDGNTLLYRDQGPFVFMDETGRSWQFYHFKLESENATLHESWVNASQACIGGDCAVTLPAYTIFEPGNYSWRVMGWKDTSGDGSWSSFANSSWSRAANFTAVKPITVTLVSPIGNLSETETTPDFVWNKTAGPSWYEVVLKDRNGRLVEGTDGSNAHWYPAGLLCDADPVTCTLPWESMTGSNSAVTLGSGSYTWTVSAWGIGFMNTIRGRFYIEGNVPKNPDILSPLPPEESGRNVTSPVPTLIWEDNGADWFCFWVGSPNNSWAQTCFNSTVCARGNCSGPLDTYFNGNYSVWGQSWKETGNEWQSSGWADTNFMLETSSVGHPSNMTPGNNSLVDGFSPVLRWTTCGNATWQNVLLMTAAGDAVKNASGAWFQSRKYCTDISNGTCSLNTTLFAPDGLRGGIYKWRVQGWNPTGMSQVDTSNDAYFSVDPYPAHKANLISPINGTRVMAMVSFKWNKTNAVWQHINVVDSSNSSKIDEWIGPGDINCTDSVCPYASSGLPPLPGGYRWRVGGWNPNNGEEITYSDWANFTI